MRYVGPVYRPPSEADSYLLQVTLGCSHNECTYCAMYRHKTFSARPLEEVLADVREAGRLAPDTRRVFLLDGDAMTLSTARLVPVLEALHAAFPRLQRVGSYVNAVSVLRKSDDDLRRLAALKLSIGYLGLETGDEVTAKAIVKGATVADEVLAVRRAQAAGIKMSVMVLLGMGGRARSKEHAQATAAALSEMDARFISCLCVTPVPGTPLYDGGGRGALRIADPARDPRRTRDDRPRHAASRARCSGATTRATTFRSRGDSPPIASVCSRRSTPRGGASFRWCPTTGAACDRRRRGARTSRRALRRQAGIESVRRCAPSHDPSPSRASRSSRRSAQGRSRRGIGARARSPTGSSASLRRRDSRRAGSGWSSSRSTKGRPSSNGTPICRSFPPRPRSSRRPPRCSTCSVPAMSSRPRSTCGAAPSTSTACSRATSCSTARAIPSLSKRDHESDPLWPLSSLAARRRGQRRARASRARSCSTTGPSTGRSSTRRGPRAISTTGTARRSPGSRSTIRASPCSCAGGRARGRRRRCWCRARRDRGRSTAAVSTSDVRQPTVGAMWIDERRRLRVAGEIPPRQEAMFDTPVPDPLALVGGAAIEALARAGIRVAKGVRLATDAADRVARRRSGPHRELRCGPRSA